MTNRLSEVSRPSPFPPEPYDGPERRRVVTPFLIQFVALWLGLHLGAWLGFVGMIRHRGVAVACRNLTLLALVWPVLVAWSFRSLIEPAWRGDASRISLIPWFGGVLLMYFTTVTAFALPMAVPRSIGFATVLFVTFQPSLLAIATAIATRMAARRTPAIPSRP